jgi:O-antigen/teichoic acid export membrane protein
MVLIITINYALSFPLSVFSSILQAYEKFVLLKLNGILRVLLTPLITLPFLFLGFGSVTMVIITSAVNLTCLTFNFYYCLKSLNVKFYFKKVDFKVLKEILSYSFLVFLGIIVDQINWNTDQFILGIFTGTLPIAVYAIAMQFIKLYRQFSTSLSGLLLPKVSMMVAQNASSDDLTKMMIKYGRIQFIIMAYILSVFILYGKPFINIWAGSNYIDAYFITLIVMVPITVPLIQNVGISILYAKNLQGFRSIVLFLIAILNVLISIPLVKSYEGIGAAIGTAISLIIGNIILMNLYYFYKLKINILLFWKSICIMSFPIFISTLIGAGIGFLISKTNLIFLFFEILLYSLIFIVISWFFILNQNEKNQITGIMISIKGLFNKAKRINRVLQK